jgi:hypothetical protein
LTVKGKDASILRSLAGQVAEIAARPLEEEKRKLWFAHNALEKVRPLVFCDPENGWNEIFPKESLLCEDPLMRQWEMRLRKEIFWGTQMNDDRVIEPYFYIGYVYKRSNWGMEEVREGGGNGGSYRWKAPLTDFKDMDKLRFPTLSINFAETERQAALASELFGDLLKVEIRGSWFWSLGVVRPLVYIRGLEQILYDIYDYPDELKQLMAFIRDGLMAELDYLEENGLLSLNNRGHYVGSGGFGYTNQLPGPDFDGKVRTMDMWGFAESQETVGISPDAFEEFVFTYELPLLSRFGLNCYGCCEPLNLRWDIVKKTPNLRRVSVSPWADRVAMADKLKDKYIYSYKPVPTDLAMPSLDHEHVRKGLRQALSDTKGCCLEIIMKDNHTIGNNPQNVIDWCRIAREEIENM